MKRFIAVLALVLVLPAFICSVATPADSADIYAEGDDHPWGGEYGDDPGRFRHSGNSGDLLATSIAAVDIVFYTYVLYEEVFTTSSKQGKIKSYDSRDERDVYIDRTRRVSLK